MVFKNSEFQIGEEAVGTSGAEEAQGQAHMNIVIEIRFSAMVLGRLGVPDKNYHDFGLIRK